MTDGPGTDSPPGTNETLPASPVPAPRILDLADARGKTLSAQVWRADASVFPKTKRKYRSALAKFDEAVADKPVADSVIADYLADLHAAGKSPGTCNQVVTALKYRARLQGTPLPVGPLTQRVLARIWKWPEVLFAQIWTFAGVSDPVTDSQAAGYLAGLRASGQSPATCSRILDGLEFRAEQQGIPFEAGPLTRRALVGTGAARPELSAKVWDLVAASVAENTRRTYGAVLAKFDRAVAGAPATDALVAGYLAGLMMAGIRRKGRGRGRGQVQGVDFAQALAVGAAAAEDGFLQGLRDAALIAVMSDGLMRVSEVAALQVDDITYEPDGTGIVTVRSSKTDQKGTGAVQFLGAATVERIEAWLDKAGLQDGPLFPRMHRGETVGQAALSTVSVRNIIKRRCADAGIEGDISGHSLRVGGAQSLAAGGASVVEMQTAGRWESPQMPGHYARRQLAARGAVARIKYGYGAP